MALVIKQYISNRRPFHSVKEDLQVCLGNGNQIPRNAMFVLWVSLHFLDEHCTSAHTDWLPCILFGSLLTLFSVFNWPFFMEICVIISEWTKMKVNSSIIRGEYSGINKNVLVINKPATLNFRKYSLLAFGQVQNKIDILSMYRFFIFNYSYFIIISFNIFVWRV